MQGFVSELLSRSESHDETTSVGAIVVTTGRVDNTYSKDHSLSLLSVPHSEVSGKEHYVLLHIDASVVTTTTTTSSSSSSTSDGTESRPAGTHRNGPSYDPARRILRPGSLREAGSYSLVRLRLSITDDNDDDDEEEGNKGAVTDGNIGIKHDPRKQVQKDSNEQEQEQTRHERQQYQWNVKDVEFYEMER